MSNAYPLEVFEDLLDEDPFIRAYPSFKRYLDEWDEKGGESVWEVPEEVVFEFYAEKLHIDQALLLWFTYND